MSDTITRHDSGQVTIRVFDSYPDAWGMRFGGIRNDSKARAAADAAIAQHFPDKSGTSFSSTGVFVHLMPPVEGTDAELEQRRAACSVALSKLSKK